MVCFGLELAPVIGGIIEAYYLVQAIDNGDIYAVVVGAGMVAVSAVGGKIYAKVGQASIELGGEAIEAGLKKIDNATGPCCTNRHLQSINTEVHMHRVRQPPVQHFPGCPIHDCHKIKKAVLDWHEGDIRAPFARQGMLKCPRGEPGSGDQ